MHLNVRQSFFADNSPDTVAFLQNIYKNGCDIKKNELTKILKRNGIKSNKDEQYSERQEVLLNMLLLKVSLHWSYFSLFREVDLKECMVRAYVDLGCHEKGVVRNLCITIGDNSLAQRLEHKDEESGIEESSTSALR